MLIYKITNLINNKCYIGQTIKTAEQRWKEHQSHAFGSHPNDQNKTLYKAIRKYGLENFTFEVLQDNIETFEQLDKAEIYWIDYYNSFVKGYNETFGGQQYHKILFVFYTFVRVFYELIQLIFQSISYNIYNYKVN